MNVVAKKKSPTSKDRRRKRAERRKNGRYFQPSQILMLATWTNEKTEDYRCIALERQFPFLVLQLQEVAGVFHSAEEDAGDCRDNALQKNHEVDGVVTLFRIKNSPYEKALRHKCKEMGVSYNPQKIIVGVEDTTFELPHSIWTILKEKIRPLAPDSLLENADKNGSSSGPGAETGTILGAVGTVRFFNFLRESALEAGWQEDKPVLMDGKTVFVGVRIGDNPGDPVIEIEARVPMTFMPPEGYEVPLQEPDAPIVLTSHFQELENKPKVPVASYWKEFVSYGSTRARILEVLETKCPNGNSRRTKKPGKPSRTTVEEFPPIQIFGNELASGLQIAEAPLLQSNQQNTIIVGNGPFERLHQALTLEAQWKESRPLIFTPFDQNSRSERIEGFRRLAAAIVTKQTNPIMMNTPILVLNDGCYNSFFVAGSGFARDGTAKNFMRGEAYERTPRIVSIRGVTHWADQYCDVININADTTATPSLWKRAAEQVLCYRRIQYRKVVAPHELGNETHGGGSLPPDDMFVVTGFTSASSDNLPLFQMNYNLAHFAGQKKWGFCSGGGDRHAMYPFIKGYADADGLWAAYVSTPEIILQETKHKKIPPGGNYWRLTNIYDRQAHLIGLGDALVAMPGGYGTAEECLSTLRLMETEPDLMAGKHIIFHNVDLFKECPYPGEPFWQNTMVAVFGRDDYERMQADHRALQEDGVIMTASETELFSTLVELAGQWDANRQNTHAKVRGRLSAAKL